MYHSYQKGNKSIGHGTDGTITSSGGLVAQQVKHWLTDLAAPGSSPFGGESRFRCTQP